MKPKPLETRIAELQAEINAFIDQCAEEVKREIPNLTLGVIRKELIQRTAECECRQYLNLAQKPEAA